ncbi:hypothetical protein J2Z79_002592 [Symbiobacterium terraclitae]|uniref:Putative Flp pilus-assembly TadG-like N-terminal domain-containing protein n=1 Tax=Symbiobacterium terraclitae TaxID=557451 RepID=A0ABS4JUH7_9FIRM|nr:hypothetical protein [Symbiobacterium terraclitae]
MRPGRTAERGSTSALFIFIWSVALIAVGIALDVGRVFVLREQLRTAEEAAALAGVLQARYVVEARFRREENRPIPVCAELEPTEPPECHLVDHWVAIEPVIIRGPEAEVWPEAHRLWAAQCNRYNVRCSRQYFAAECWIEPRSDWAAVRSAALSAFQANARWGGQARTAGPVAVEVETGGGSKPRQLRVSVTAVLEMETLLLPILGVDSLMVTTPGEPTAAELVRREWTGQKVWIGGVQVPSPCLSP